MELEVCLKNSQIEEALFPQKAGRKEEQVGSVSLERLKVLIQLFIC